MCKIRVYYSVNYIHRCYGSPEKNLNSASDFPRASTLSIITIIINEPYLYRIFIELTLHQQPACTYRRLKREI